MLPFDDIFHPNGRCECCGEGRCSWCQKAEAVNRAETNNTEKLPASRFAYTQFSNSAKAYDDLITEHAKELECSINRAPNGREKSLALTKLEEAVMWARKALRGVA